MEQGQVLVVELAVEAVKLQVHRAEHPALHYLVQGLGGDWTLLQQLD